MKFVIGRALTILSWDNPVTAFFRKSKILRHSLGRPSRSDFVHLEFDDSCIDNPKDLKVKVFTEADREWVRFILKNRDSDCSVHDYDIVIGPTADENTVTLINSYKEELVASNYADEVLDTLIKELKPENLPKQYFFGTEAAIQKLYFKKVRRETVG